MSREQKIQDLFNILDGGYDQNGLLTPSLFKKKFRAMTGKNLEVSSELINGFYERVEAYTSANKTFQDDDFLSENASRVVEYLHQGMNGLLQINSIEYVVIGDVFIKYAMWNFYLRKQLPNFDILKFIDELTILEASSIIMTLEKAGQKPDNDIFDRLMKKCNPYLFSIDMKATPALTMMNAQDSNFFHIFVNNHIKDSFDLLRLFNHCKNHEYKLTYMIELYNSFVKSINEYPEIYIHITNKVISQSDTNLIRDWFIRNKPCGSMVFSMNQRTSYVALQEIARHTDITKIIMKETSLSILHYELTQTELNVSSIGFLLYHHGDLNKVKFGNQPLAIFITKLNNPIVQEFMKQYVIDWTIKCDEGHNCLYYSCQTNNKEMATFLIDRGVKLEKDAVGINQEITDYYQRTVGKNIIDWSDQENYHNSSKIMTSILTSSKY